MSAIYDDEYGLDAATGARVVSGTAADRCVRLWREMSEVEMENAELRRSLKAERDHADRLAEALEAALPAADFAEEFTARGDDWFHLLGRDALADHLKRRGL